jgi:hypothetical protein
VSWINPLTGRTWLERSTYRYRDREARREQMKGVMRRRRARLKEKNNNGRSLSASD